MCGIVKDGGCGIVKETWENLLRLLWAVNRLDALNRARLLYRPAPEDRLGNATVNNAQEDIDSYAKALGCVW